jgi:hypothetical protein
MTNIRRVDGEMRASRQEAADKKLATADLACKAAEHIELCASVGRTVSEAQQRTQNALDTANGQIASAQQEIEDTNRMSSEMTNNAETHDERAKGNNIVKLSYYILALLFWEITNFSCSSSSGAHSGSQGSTPSPSPYPSPWKRKPHLPKIQPSIDQEN